MFHSAGTAGLPGTGFRRCVSLADPGDRVSAQAVWPSPSALCSERAWPKGTEESYDDWKVRLKQTALALPENVIRKAMQSMRRRCLELCDNGGEWIKND